MEKSLTIAIPVYNGGQPLLEAIASCKHIGLHVDEFEILLVDNCSTDGKIEEAISKYFSDLPIRTIRNEFNCGRINNWNKCIENASGEFLLFLFANDLIATENSILDAIRLFRKNDKCDLVSAPWIYSDFEQLHQYIEPEFYRRTPAYGYQEAFVNIKKVVESGKLPFVCLQSCFIRVNSVLNNSIKFDEEIPLTTDGVFLCQLASLSGIVGFIDKPTMIFRHNAPNRQHANVKLHQHIEQMLEAFARISKIQGNQRIDLSKAFSNFTGLENMIAFVIKNFDREGLRYAGVMIYTWINSVKEHKTSTILFHLRLIKRFLLLPFKGVVFVFKRLNKG
jgi:glycosyltransferase involved in cell wall biosynthesis